VDQEDNVSHDFDDLETLKNKDFGNFCTWSFLPKEIKNLGGLSKIIDREKKSFSSESIFFLGKQKKGQNVVEFKSFTN